MMKKFQDNDRETRLKYPLKMLEGESMDSIKVKMNKMEDSLKNLNKDVAEVDQKSQRV